MKDQFKKSWKASKKPNKQRKYRYNAPLHVKQRLIRAHLSAELRKKHNKRNIGARTGDKVKIMRGNYKGKAGKVSKIELKGSRVYVEGAEFTKKDGSKILYPVHVSNVVITELNLDDKKRELKLKGLKTKTEKK